MARKRVSYYELYLKKYLQDIGHPKSDDQEFITMRADAAAEEAEKSARQGLSVAQAEESAMAVLLDELTDVSPSQEESEQEKAYQKQAELDEQLLRESGYYVSEEIPDNENKN